jgi:predicted Zn-dependent protease
MRRICMRLVPVLGCCVLAGACAVNPATGQRQLALVSEQQEVQLGQQAAEETRAALGLVQNDALQTYVREVGSRLAAGSERPNLPWSFQVVNDPTPNAFALPGGFIFVTRGMLNHMDSEAELASVLGHEIAHVTARHSVEQISRAQLAQLGFGVGMILFPDIQSFGGLLSSGLQLLFLKFGRDAERQADELGFRYALEQQYDVREMADVFTTLQQISAREGGSPLPAWASTHPDPGERVETVRKRVAALDIPLEGLKVGREPFLTQIDGLVWGEDPRQGFFQGNRFLHPDMRFEMTFPQGWRTQNLPQAVIAASPEQDAVIQLTLASGTPREALQRFAAQSGVQVSQPTDETVNGLPAAAVRFAAQSEQGQLEGTAVLIAYNDRTYQIIGYTPAGRLAQRNEDIVRTARSFAPLTDERILAIEPRRLDVVPLPRQMSLAQFAESYPSAVDLDTLVLLNQVESAETPLPAGRLVKRVVGEKVPASGNAKP